MPRRRAICHLCQYNAGASELEPQGRGSVGSGKCDQPRKHLEGIIVRHALVQLLVHHPLVAALRSLQWDLLIFMLPRLYAMVMDQLVSGGDGRDNKGAMLNMMVLLLLI